MGSLMVYFLAIGLMVMVFHRPSYLNYVLSMIYFLSPTNIYLISSIFTTNT